MKSTLIIPSLILCLSTYGGTLVVDQFSISGGGGASQSGRFGIVGTINPEGKEQLKGGSYKVEPSSYSLVSVVQTHGAPTLRLAISSTTATLSWPVTEGVFQLQASQNLAVLNGWANVLQGAATNNGTISVTVPLTPGNKFFRLRK